MTREEAEAVLAAAGRASNEVFPLFEASLACAVHEDPTRDPEPARVMAEQAAARLSEHMAASPIDEALAETMAGDLRLTGDLMTYDHPANTDIITVWERRGAYHHSILAEQVTAFDPGIGEFFGTLATRTTAPALLEQTINQQATLLASNDIFWLSGCCFVALMLLVWLARPPRHAPVKAIATAD